ncbi:MAG: hypothetical protein WC959_01820 [Kiritimatiellales bacterium]
MKKEPRVYSGVSIFFRTLHRFVFAAPLPLSRLLLSFRKPLFESSNTANKNLADDSAARRFL